MKNQILTQNEQIAQAILGTESDARIMNMSDDVLIGNQLKDQAKAAFNQEVADYVEKLDKQQDLLNEYSKQFADNMQNLEIMPLYRYALIRPFEQNPFQQMKRSGSIITDVGGPVEFENTDTGEWQVAESYIQVATVIEIGPECKYLQVGDVIMYKKESAFPVPFYGQGFHIVDEQRVSAAINEGLHDRIFNNLKSN